MTLFPKDFFAWPRVGLLSLIVLASSTTLPSAELIPEVAVSTINNPAKIHGIWVYPNSTSTNTITNSAARDRFINSAKASKINMVYVSVYSSTTNSKGRQLYDESALAAFVGAAHAAGMQVYADYGTPTWYTDGCGTTSSPSWEAKRLLEIAAYNATNPRILVQSTLSSSYVGAAFDGVILDIEPSNPVDYNGLFSFYACAQKIAQQNHYGMAAAVSAFWNDPTTFNGSTKEAYKHLVTLGLNHLVVMGYRNFAGTEHCSDGDGLVCLNWNLVNYANASSIVIGIETTHAPEVAKESFNTKGAVAMNTEAQAVYDYFNSLKLTVGGFAIDSYQDLYIGGASTLWPSVNLGFPTGPKTTSPSRHTNSFVREPSYRSTIEPDGSVVLYEDTALLQ